jgi:MFS family permease
MLSERNALRAFSHYNFRLYWSANLISNIGTWAARIAQDWLVVHDLHKGGAELGVVTALQFAPAFFLSIHGGALADLFPKRKLLIFTNIGGGVSSLAMGLLIVANRIQLWEVFVIAFISGIFSAIDSPVRQSFNSEVVSKENVANAISLNSANFNTGRIIGPAISGLLIQAFHTGPSFIINGASFIFVIAALIMMKSSELNTPPVRQRAPISEALRYLKKRKDLILIMATVFFAATFGLNFQIFNTLLATKIFNKSAGAYGLLGTFLAIGALAAAIVSANMERWRQPKFITRFAAGFGLALSLLAWLPKYLEYSLALPVVGFIALTTMINANSYVQTTTESHVRGRIMGIYLFIFLGTSPLGSLLIGYLSDHIGIRQTVTFCGVMTLVGSIVAYRLLRKSVVIHNIAN